MRARDELEEQLDRAPHDEGPFLVLADWLLERGDPQGELIRVQHALARAPSDPALVARDAELRQALLPALHPYPARWELGFPRHVTLTWVTDDAFPALDVALRSPLCRFVEGVSLTDYLTSGKVLEPLLALPRLEEVTLTSSLELISPHRALQLLSRLAPLTRLTRLELCAREVTAALGELPAFALLRRLTLSEAWLRAEDARALRAARARVGPHCALVLQRTSLSLEVEALVQEAWPARLEVAHAPGLLVEEPAAERGRYLLARGRDLRIGSHPACDLPIAGQRLDAVHAVFDGTSLREPGDLDGPRRRLRSGERLPVGGVVLRFCDDVAAARLALASGPRGAQGDGSAGG